MTSFQAEPTGSKDLFKRKIAFSNSDSSSRDFETDNKFTDNEGEKQPDKDNAVETPASTKKVLQTFVETSSVKGVPKIFKSKTRVQRLLWAICLVIGLAIGLTQIVLLFLQYFQYQTVVTTQEIYSEMPTFPDVSVCNINPISTGMPVNLTFSQYMTNIYDIGLPMVFPGFTSVSDIDYSALSDMQDFMISAMFSAKGYFSNILSPEDDSLSQYSDTFINDCVWSKWDFNSEERIIKCGSNGSESQVSIDYFYENHYGPCFTLKLSSKELARKAEKLTVILYLQDISETSIFDFHTTTDWSYSSGVRVKVHPRGTLPNMRSTRVAPAGHETTMWVSQSERRRLDEPYGDCYAKDHLPDSPEYGYDWQTCHDLCHQDKVIQRCGCITPELLFTPRMRRNYAFCPQMDYVDFNNTYSRVQCALDKYDATACHCKPACKEVQYTSRLDQAPWPHESHHEAFWIENIYLTVPDYERFAIYDNITDYDELFDLNLIRRNFLQLNVNLEKPGYTTVTDTQQLTIPSLFGSLGGILNLWIGITFVTLIEICDLVYQLVTSQIERRKNKNKVDGMSEGVNTE